MKRYFCTVATGLLLALVGTGTATASLLPLPGDPGNQETNLLPPGPPGGEEKKGSDGQSVEQDNDADVRNKQTNANVLSPPIAVAVLGNAEASNEQSNKAETEIEQENEAKQDSSSSSGGGNGCCTGQSQAGEQDVEQDNDADVRNKQTNANVLSPPIAVAVLGNAEASNEQSNKAETEIEQENEAKQDSSSSSGGGNGCCTGQSQAGEQDVEQDNDADVRNKQTNANVLSPPVALGILGKAEAENEQSNVSKTEIEQENEAKQDSSSSSGGGNGCCTGQSQAGEQDVEQDNDADVRNKQTNANVLSPPVALGILGKAEAENEQSNVSKTEIEQENEAKQESEQRGGGCCKPAPPCHNSCTPKKEYDRSPHCSSTCEPNGAPGREQGPSSDGGGQSVRQDNDADVRNKQTNANVLSPPVALGILGKAEAENEQSNVSKTEIEQENEAKQESEQRGGGCCKPAPPCHNSCTPKKEYDRSPHCSSTCEPNGAPGREQGPSSDGGGQSVRQDNDADVRNKQTNANVLSPPVALGILGKAEAENEQSNVSKTEIEQENEAKQESEQRGGGCCKPAPPCHNSCTPKKEYDRSPHCSSTCEPNGAPGREQGPSSDGGGQSVRQDNDADVRNKQTNANVLSPPVALGILGKAEAENEQSNVSKTEIEQENEAYQHRNVVDMCKGLVYR